MSGSDWDFLEILLLDVFPVVFFYMLSFSFCCCVNFGTVACRSHFMWNICTDPIQKVHCSNWISCVLIVFPKQFLFTESQLTKLDNCHQWNASLWLLFCFDCSSGKLCPLFLWQWSQKHKREHGTSQPFRGHTCWSVLNEYVYIVKLELFALLISKIRFVAGTVVYCGFAYFFLKRLIGLNLKWYVWIVAVI